MGFTQPDGPSSPEHYAAVPVVDVDANDVALPDLSGAFGAAAAAAGAGVLYAQSQRQAQAEALLESPPGYGAGGFTIFGGAPDLGFPVDMSF